MPDHTTERRTEPRPMTARALATTLAECAEPFCRRYLPHGHRHGRYWFAGDIHGAPGRSLRVCLAPPGHPGLWTDDVTGQRGGPLELLRLRLGDATPERALAEARRFLAATAHTTAPRRRAQSPHARHHRTEAPVRLWNLCRSIHGSHAEAYLHARGIEHCRGLPALRFHPNLFYRTADDAQHALPALVAAVADPAGLFTGVQRTWLDPRRPVKANLSHPRKALGRIHGCAVYLGEPHATLVVAQGIETALALRTACPDLAVAATLTETSFGAYTAPERITRLIVAHDNVPASAQAAERLLARCRRRALCATVVAAAGKDFNDDLLALGRDALGERIRQAAGPRRRL